TLGRYAVKSRAAWLLAAGFGLVAAAAVVRIDQYTGLGALDWIGVLVGALVVSFGQFSAPVLAFALALYLWWRGLRLGRQAPSYVDTESAFRWGIGRLVTFALILSI